MATDTAILKPLQLLILAAFIFVRTVFACIRTVFACVRPQMLVDGLPTIYVCSVK